jgi:hypothetical protein
MKRKIKTMMMARQVKTGQQAFREVSLRRVSFQTLARWQSEYTKLSDKKGVAQWAHIIREMKGN